MTCRYKLRAERIIRRIHRIIDESGGTYLDALKPSTIDEVIYTVCTSRWGRSPLFDAAAVALAKWTPMVMLFVITVAGFGFAWPVHHPASIVPSLAAVISAVLARGLNEPLTRLFARPRPFEMSMINPLLRHETGESFPSNHATGAFALACPFIGCEPYADTLFILAILLCLSRIYTGLHYFTDVVAGAVNGTVVALLVVLAAHTIYGLPLFALPL